MRDVHDKARILMAGVFCLVGLGVLLETRFFWPGIIFLAATASLIQAWAARGPEERRTMTRVGLTLAMIGLWALVRFDPSHLLSVLAFLMVVWSRRIPSIPKKAYVDQRLD